MNKEDTSQPAEMPKDIPDPDADEPLVVDEEEAAETEQIKAELRDREGKRSHESS
jgi:hypothetical protein